MLLPRFIAGQSAAKRGAILRSLTSGGNWWPEFADILEREAMPLEEQQKLKVWRDHDGFYYARFHYEIAVCAPPFLFFEVFGTAEADGVYMKRLEAELTAMGQAIALGQDWAGEWLEAAKLYRQPDVELWKKWHTVQTRAGVLRKVTGW